MRFAPENDPSSCANQGPKHILKTQSYLLGVNLARIPTPISLSQLVHDAAEQLREIKANEPENPVIKFESCEIELSVGVMIEAGGKVKLVVWEAGADATYENTQRISLKFSSIGPPIVAVVGDGTSSAPLPQRQQDKR